MPLIVTLSTDTRALLGAGASFWSIRVTSFTFFFLLLASEPLALGSFFRSLLSPDTELSGWLKGWLFGWLVGWLVGCERPMFCFRVLRERSWSSNVLNSFSLRNLNASISSSIALRFASRTEVRSESKSLSSSEAGEGRKPLVLLSWDACLYIFQGLFVQDWA